MGIIPIHLKPKAVYVFLLVLMFNHVQGQADSTNIKSYVNQIMIRANLDTNLENFTFSEVNGEDVIKEMVVSVNNKTRASLSVDYRNISATVSFMPKLFPGNNDNDLKGKSSYTDFRFRFFPGRFIQTVYYKNVKGFYVENMQDLIPGWQEGRDKYIQFPDLRVQTFGGSTSYVLKKEFSLKSIYTQGEWQKNSRGSFVPFLDYDLTIFRELLDGRKGKEYQYNIGANIGYFYNWVIAGKVSVAPYLTGGIGGKFTNFRDTREDGSKGPKEKAQYVAVRGSGGLHIGYNSDRFLFGGKFNFNATAYDQRDNYIVENNNTYGLIYIGYRFAPPKAVKNTYDKIQKQVPIL
ncbi:hypothetical protein CHRYSEOSP005_00390 [Chryseobacterium sp. Alg-005]|uniref:DUF4421 family protein n=1 Tax=Chryseobacterium sp. Alg-005 TaxID=3159516 RepID=UPI0035557823